MFVENTRLYDIVDLHDLMQLSKRSLDGHLILSSLTTNLKFVPFHSRKHLYSEAIVKDINLIMTDMKFSYLM